MEATEPTARPVIGLEIHAQLLTRSKMFCNCSAQYADSPPNSQVCPVCGGMPGALPVINREAIEQGIRTAIALNCTVAEHSKFDRKNYQYPDIPKGYQISQYDLPVGRGGWIDYHVLDDVRRCGVTRVHLEEDTGKSLHTVIDGREVSLVDYNRSGVALMEIVTEPDLHSPEEASTLFEQLRQILMYLGVCDGKLQEGSMRADVNVSLQRPDGAFGTKVEIKNLNSFRSVHRALKYEIERQQRALQSGDAVVQETRGWNEKLEITVSQRTKEYAHDYRYFPEPDLPSLNITPRHVDKARSTIPQLPLNRFRRFVDQYSLGPAQARELTATRDIADFYEAVVDSAPQVSPLTVANWVLNDVMKLLHESHHHLTDVPVPPSSLGQLLGMIERGEISGRAGKEALEVMFASGEPPEVIVDRLDLRQITNRDQLVQLVDEVLATSDKLVATYRSGKTNALEALVGRVIKASNRKANPEAVREILLQRLAG